MENRLRQAADRQRIWRRNSLRRAWRFEYALDRGVSNEPISAPNRDVTENSVSRGHVPLGADGFSFAAPPARRCAGLFQSQGANLRPRATQTGVLHPAEILQRNGNRAASAVNIHEFTRSPITASGCPTLRFLKGGGLDARRFRAIPATRYR